MGQKSGRKGPDPETVKIDMDWEKAVGKALGKKKPKDGWPDRPPPKGGKKRR